MTDASRNADSERTEDDYECAHDSYWCCSDMCEWPHCLVRKASSNESLAAG
jgi:hypothetical protein